MQAVTIPTPTTPPQSLESAIGVRIHEKFGHIRSEKTRIASTETITAFRKLLQLESLQCIAGVCRHYLDTSKMHTMRHSFALFMQAIGAKLTDIQKLLNSNPATTGLYLETIARNQNQFIGKLTALLGVSGMMAKLLAPRSEE